MATDLGNLSFQELFSKGFESEKDRKQIEQYIYEKPVEFDSDDKDFPVFPSSSAADAETASKPTQAKRIRRDKAATGNDLAEGVKVDRSFWGPKLKILDITYRCSSEESSLTIENVVKLINNSADTLKDLSIGVVLVEKGKSEHERRKILQEFESGLSQLSACVSFKLKSYSAFEPFLLDGIPLMKHFPSLESLSLTNCFGVDAHTDLGLSKIKQLNLTFSLDPEDNKQYVFSQHVIFPVLEDLLVNLKKLLNPMDFSWGGPEHFGIMPIDWDGWYRKEKNPFPNLVSVQVPIDASWMCDWVIKFINSLMHGCDKIRKLALINGAGNNTLAGYFCMEAHPVFYSRIYKIWPITHLALIGFDIYATGFILGLTPELESLKLDYTEGEGEKFPTSGVDKLKKLKELNINADFYVLPAKDFKALVAKMPKLETLAFHVNQLSGRKKGKVFNLYDIAPGLKRSLKTLYISKEAEKNCKEMMDQCRARKVKVINFVECDGGDEIPAEEKEESGGSDE